MSKPASRDGVVLIEFLIVALLLLMIVFMGAQFGLMISRLQFTAEGARIAVKEASTKPGALVFPGASGLYVDSGVFDERYTVIDLSASFPDPATGAPLPPATTLDGLFSLLPAGNRALRAHMVVDNVSVAGKSLLRFQGVLLQGPAGPFRYVVRVPDVAGASARLRRIINPPAANPADGLLQFECWQWFPYTTWLLPGGAVLPAALAYSNFPPGYATVVKLDVEAASRAGTSLVSFSVARKEIQ